MIVGVDYASIDGNRPPDFAAAKAWGVRFVIVRAAFCDAQKPLADKTVARDRAAIAAAGMTFGAYLILHWRLDPVAQAKTFIGAYGKRAPGDFAPTIDVEFGNSIHDWGITVAQARERLLAAREVLLAEYGIVQDYSSARAFREELGDLDIPELAADPLWLCVPYSAATKQPPNPAAARPIMRLPMPWRRASSAGAWIRQSQGDALGVPGFSSTVDINDFLAFSSATDPRAPWVHARLDAAGVAPGAVLDRIEAFQTARRLKADRIIGPQTFAALT